MATMRIKLYSDSAGVLQAEFLDGLSSISQNNAGNNVIEVVPDFALSENEALQMGFSTSLNEADPSTQNVGFTLMENPEAGIYRTLVPPLVLATRGTWYLQIRSVSGWLEASNRYANINHSNWLEFEINATIYDTMGAYPNNGDILALYGEAQRLKKSTGRLERLEEAQASAEKVLEAKLDKITSPTKVYATDGVGNFKAMNYTRNIGRNALVWRDADGKSEILTPEDGAENATENDIINRAYASGKFLVKSAKNSVIYGTGNTGTQKEYPIGSAVVGGIPLVLDSTLGDVAPDGNGFLLANNPTKPYQVANKRYVDNSIAENAVQKTDTVFQVYCTNGSGKQYTKWYAIRPEMESFMYRDVNGCSQVNTPVNVLDIANKKYVDNALEGKVDKIKANAEYMQVYVKTKIGVDKGIPLTNSLFTDANGNNNESVVLRTPADSKPNNSGGGRIKAALPIDDNDVTSKKYVDEKVAALVDSAPETLDTLKEVATAIQENETVVEALNSAIGTKANTDEVVNLTDDQTINGNKTFTGKVVADELEAVSDSGVATTLNARTGLTVKEGSNATRYTSYGIARNEKAFFNFPSAGGYIATQEWASENFVNLTGDQIIHGSKSFTGNIVFESSNTLTMLYGGAVAEYRADGIRVNQAYWLQFPYDFEINLNQTIATREWVKDQSPKLYRHDLIVDVDLDAISEIGEMRFSIYTKDAEAYDDVTAAFLKSPQNQPVMYYSSNFSGVVSLEIYDVFTGECRLFGTVINLANNQINVVFTGGYFLSIISDTVTEI